MLEMSSLRVMVKRKRGKKEQGETEKQQTKNATGRNREKAARYCDRKQFI